MSQPPLAFMGRTTHRAKPRPFGIRYPDRLAHVYVIGRTGTGKTTLLESLLAQDLWNGHGVALVDPHGDLAHRVAAQARSLKRDDLVFLDVPDPTQPYGLNPLARTPARYRMLAASGLLEVLRKLWDDRAWGPRMEHILRNALLLLLDQPKASLADIPRLLTDRSYRRTVVEQSSNPQVQAFWRSEFESYPPRLRADAIAPIQNKIGAFLADPTLRRILTEPETRISLRSIMDSGGVLVANLSRGQVGSDSANLLGGLLLSTIALAAYSRAGTPPHERRPFYVFVDEFQAFATRSLGDMAAELRKYGVALVLAHQFLHQLEPEVRYSVLGNAGTLVSFRVGPQDAPLLAREFRPRIGEGDLLGLPNYRIYLKLMIDGAPCPPFSAETLLPAEALRSSRHAGRRQRPREAHLRVERREPH